VGLFPIKNVRSPCSRRYKGQLDKTADQFISVIVGGAQRTEELVQTLLRYAQLGEQEIAKTPVAVDTCAGESPSGD
jgi:light-regulated signal transduction histidine kinase (bacteriophytochrome)